MLDVARALLDSFAEQHFDTETIEREIFSLEFHFLQRWFSGGSGGPSDPSLSYSCSLDIANGDKTLEL